MPSSSSSCGDPDGVRLLRIWDDVITNRVSAVLANLPVGEPIRSAGWA